MFRVDAITYTWRGSFTNIEFHALHAEAFEHRLYNESEWDVVTQCGHYSLGWVVARSEDRFGVFVYVIWDGRVHSFIEDVIVDVVRQAQETSRMRRPAVLNYMVR